jgi:putative DNA primase/helicase
VLGDYGCTSNPETISTSRSDNGAAPSEDIARLVGVRFVNISEPKRGLALNAAQVKSMTGNDTITARFLHQNSFQFRPQFKLYINTNHRPVITDMTLFRSNRVISIPFTRHFEESEQDNTLKVQFATEENQSAILNWLIEGYLLLRREGLKPPTCVLNEIADYEEESDRIKQFFEETMIAAEGYKTRTSAIYEKYKLWCEQNGYYAENNSNFKQALKAIAPIEKQRPDGGGSPTTVIIGYKISDMAYPIGNSYSVS